MALKRGGLIKSVLKGAIKGIGNGGIGGGNILRNVAEEIQSDRSGGTSGIKSRDGGDFSQSLDSSGGKDEY